ncbi:MAG: sn-glycerol-3-phosphate ABC transporter ATP-binding protein UgpC [Myxococcales bacterium]|nr:sn-glycerol-3-phosphate ABC transporter ATP-binding protein UgpC [Myxococcales bacterium]
MASVTLRGVGKDFGATTILPSIDLEIADGTFLVLVGPSGCGKSTVLRIVAGLEAATRGDVAIDGESVTDKKPRDRDVAMVFQSYALYPHMTVRENLAFALRLRKDPQAAIDARVAEVGEMLGLGALLERFPRQLSGGQRQRVAMGRAIVRRPRVFLFDEPLSTLDAALRGKLRVELKRLHQQLKSTMIYVTHDQIEAMTLADQIVVLNGGVIQQHGTPDELYRRPANRFVAGFIGSPPMNFLDVEIAKDGDGSAMRAPGLELRLPERWPEGPAVLGLRPNDLVPSDDAAAPLSGEVDVVEPIGWEAHLHGRIGETPVCAQLTADVARRYEPASTIRFDIAPRALHLFDRDSGARLSAEAQDA